MAFNYVVTFSLRRLNAIAVIEASASCGSVIWLLCGKSGYLAYLGRTSTKAPGCWGKVSDYLNIDIAHTCCFMLLN